MTNEEFTEEVQEEKYSKKFTNHLIIDTCVALFCGELLVNLMKSICSKDLSFKVVIPIIVREELMGRTRGKMITPYASWCKHPAFELRRRNISQQAATMVRYFDECVRRNVPNICYQGDDETSYLPATNNDDLILDCSLYYKQEYDGHATLVSHDFELCCKAELLRLNSIYQTEHAEWQCLLRACKIDDLDLEWLPKQSDPKSTKVYQRRFKYEEDELLTRRSRHREVLIHIDVIPVDELDILETPWNIERWKERPTLNNAQLFD